MNHTCTIVFLDGECMIIEYEKQADASIMARLVDDALDRNTLAFEIDGQLVVFPMANLRSITINPSPVELPRLVIKGASLRKGVDDR